MPALDVHLTPDGKIAVVPIGRGGSGRIAFVNTQTGTLLGPPVITGSSNPRATNHVTISPDGNRAFVTGGANTDSVIVFDLTQPTPTVIRRVGMSAAPIDININAFVDRTTTGGSAAGGSADVVPFDKDLSPHDHQPRFFFSHDSPFISDEVKEMAVQHLPVDVSVREPSLWANGVPTASDEAFFFNVTENPVTARVDQFTVLGAAYVASAGGQQALLAWIPILPFGPNIFREYRRFS